MMKTANSQAPGLLIPTVEEVPQISDDEREALHASLNRARADIVAGNFDVVTSATLQAEFDEIFHSDRADYELDTTPRSAP